MAAGLIAASLALAALAPEPLGGDARWAAFRWEDGRCEARGRGWRVLPDSQRHRQPMISFLFEEGAAPYLHVRLRRAVAPNTRVQLVVDETPFLLTGEGHSAFAGSAEALAVIAALRTAAKLRVTARHRGGGRFTDYYPVGGVPAAIDAAATGCARAPR
ncbi:hypothetical protein [Sphingomicrobium astaxanthinifaciens]|uniref:hypothetical protein n=1 Tax=Sphingomicrobium astaxanthinifaciens TaxID=1227949 RepID=UPI001FCB905D|nr:hypothetical protein [Sphingomicrobium astaxanthinifaciens]MCJ7421293.1 hypothetical protein [Sphingomicrobium astaxanthinifaciens]